MPELIYEYAIHVNEETGEYYSYWHEHWPMDLLAKELLLQGPVVFAASYQNDPSGLDGNILKTDWLHFYLPEDLAAARASGLSRSVHAAIDPAGGGKDPNSDYCAAVAGEKYGKRAFLTHHFLERLPIDRQADRIEEFLDAVGPDYTVVEDTSSKGYVWLELTKHVHDNAGTCHLFKIEKPQSGHAIGNKMARFLFMAPRFQNSVIMLPGIRKGIHIECHPDWLDFYDQWRDYPAGHDDALDALYWFSFSAFGLLPVASISKSADGLVTDAHAKGEQPKEETYAPLPSTMIKDPQTGQLRPITLLEKLEGVTGDKPKDLGPTIGMPGERRARIGGFRQRIGYGR